MIVENSYQAQGDLSEVMEAMINLDIVNLVWEDVKPEYTIKYDVFIGEDKVLIDVKICREK